VAKSVYTSINHVATFSYQSWFNFEPSIMVVSHQVWYNFEQSIMALLLPSWIRICIRDADSGCGSNIYQINKKMTKINVCSKKFLNLLYKTLKFEILHQVFTNQKTK